MTAHWDGFSTDFSAQPHPQITSNAPVTGWWLCFNSDGTAQEASIFFLLRQTPLHTTVHTQSQELYRHFSHPLLPWQLANWKIYLTFSAALSKSVHRSCHFWEGTISVPALLSLSLSFRDGGRQPWRRLQKFLNQIYSGLDSGLIHRIHMKNSKWLLHKNRLKVQE